jgi:hypothetical protein
MIAWRSSVLSTRGPATYTTNPCVPEYFTRMDLTPSPASDHPLDALVQRSNELHAALASVLSEGDFHPARRVDACLAASSLALEHAAGVRALMATGLATSAAGLMRLQFEALARATWLLYAAKDSDIEKLLAPLTPDAEQAAKNLPSVTAMIDAIGREVGAQAPALAHQMLVEFRDVSWPAMNSFVHGGIHPLRRHTEGFPVHLAVQLLRNSNGLTVMTGMTMAVLTGDETITIPVRKMQIDFADCLPELRRARQL